MIRWQYKYIYFKSNTNNNRIEVMLNQMGYDGWELVQVISAGGSDGTSAKIHSFIFKRPDPKSMETY